MTRKQVQDRQAGTPVHNGGPSELVYRQIAQAQYFQQTGFSGNAEKIYKSILANYPEQPDCLHYLGLLYSDQGKSRLALEYINKSLRICPDNPIYHNNLGLVLGRQQQYSEAEQAHKKAITLKPDYAEAWYNLGIVCFQQKKPEAAEAAYRRAIDIRPSYIKAMFNLVSVLEQLERHGEAAEMLGKVQAVLPDTPEAHTTLGLALAKIGGLKNLRKAEEHFRLALQLDPTHLDALLGLGQLFEDGNQIEEAIKCYRRVLELEPAHRQAGLHLGWALIKDMQLPQARTCLAGLLDKNPQDADVLSGMAWVLLYEGDFSEAEKEFRRTLAINEKVYPAYLGIAQCRKFTGNDSAMINKMIALDTEAPNPFLAFALGKIHDNLAEYDQAFDFYRQGNVLKNRHIAFDLEKNTRGIDKVIAGFDSALVKRFQGAGNPTELPVFIVGTPRSGTTLAEQIISAHPRVASAGELPFIYQLVHQLKKRVADDDSYMQALLHLNAAELDQQAGDYLAKLQSRVLDKDILRITDKMPHNFNFVGYILLLFPRARIIHCRRHPLDACLSMYFTFFQARHDYSFDLENLGYWYRNYVRLMDHWKKLYGHRILDIDYDDTVGDLETTARRLLAFCDLAWSDDCLRFHDVEKAVTTASAWQVRQPIYKTSLERWKRYEKHIGILKEILAGYY